MKLRLLWKVLGVIVAVGTILAGSMTGLAYVFATKTEVLELDKAQAETRGESRLRDFRITRLEIQVQNVENIARRTDKNVEKLLLMRRMQPGPAPKITPLPPMPTDESLETTE